ncbi:MAG: NAD(P)H-hydrate dehydratase [Clostridiales bacterium]|nr:NAD(P)H-hydrate dehydratase [Clostridiales bacterium]
MIKTITPSDMKRIETLVMRQTEITGEMLMERAAAHVARAALRHLNGASGTVLCLCGTGNNGGDGIAAMRMLASSDPSFQGECWIMGGNHSPDFLGELDKLQALLSRKQPPSVTLIHLEPNALPPCPSHVTLVIDALFGTGLTRDLDDSASALCAFSNALLGSGVPVIAVDIPSGLNGESGAVMGTGIYATETITFHRPKLGLYLREGLSYAGKITIADIGLPSDYDDAQGLLMLEKQDMSQMLPPRKRASHKGNYGRVLLFAGHRGMAGAAALAASAALKTGAGLTTVACDERILDIVQTLCPCATCIPLPFDDPALAWAALEPALCAADAIGAGCGLGQSETAGILLQKMIAYVRENPKPLVLDADALNYLASAPQPLSSRTILTPHPAEAARLLGWSIDDVISKPLKAAKALQSRYSSSIVLKGAASILVSGDEMAVNPFGTAAMAKGGSGDLLTGIISALCAGRVKHAYAFSTLSLLQTACAMHGLAGKQAERIHGERGVLATDICQYIGMNHECPIAPHAAIPAPKAAPSSPHLGSIVSVTIDHQVGSRSEDKEDLIYRLNYGYVQELLESENDWQDAYIYGITQPLEWFEGEVIAIIHRHTDAKDQWVVAQKGTRASAHQIKTATHFIEKDFDSTIEML